MNDYPPSSDYLPASLYLGGMLFATGEVVRYSPNASLSFFPDKQLILDTSHAAATLVLEGMEASPISVTNLRQCSASKTHWDLDLVEQ